MHILFVADGDSKYGAPHSLYQMVAELVKLVEDIEISIVLTKQSNMVDDFEKIGCHVYKISYAPYQQVVPFQKWKYPIKYIIRGIPYWYGRVFAVKELERKMDVKQIDLIHSNSSREDLGALLSKKHSIPLIWHIREFGDLDYSCYSYRKDYISLMNKSATEFIAISEAVMNHWINKGIRRDKIIQIYNGVRENDTIKSNYPKKGDVIRLVMMGSLNETKGQHYVIQAIALLPEEDRKRIQVDIVGDGVTAYTKILEKLIKINHLSEQVRLLGYKKDFYRYLSKYDCGIMCSRSEGFGRVTVEYMMAGLPVIVSDTGANPEIVNHGVNGLLHKYGDVIDLAEKISYLLNNENEIERIGRNAYRTAVEKYTAHINASEIYKEYQKLLEK